MGDKGDDVNPEETVEENDAKKANHIKVIKLTIKKETLKKSSKRGSIERKELAENLLPEGDFNSAVVHVKGHVKWKGSGTGSAELTLERWCDDGSETPTGKIILGTFDSTKNAPEEFVILPVDQNRDSDGENEFWDTDDSGNWYFL